METEIELGAVLAKLQEQIGLMAVENAALKVALEQSQARLRELVEDAASASE